MAGWWHEHRVRERAHELWMQAGCPEGQAEQHWAQAEAEIAAAEKDLDEETRLEQGGAV